MNRAARLLAAFARFRRDGGRSWTGWLHPYRSLRLTRDGWFFLSVTMGLGFAALNTGHNLFYLIFAMLVSLIIVSGLLSEGTVKSLEVERALAREIYARGPAAIEIRVQNRSRRRTAYAVEIRDGVEPGSQRSVGFIDRLDPGARRSFHSLWTFERRGRHRFRSLHLVTRFPFGIFEKTRIVPLREEFLVLPAIDRERRWRSSIELRRASVRKNRTGEEMLSLRPRLPDDDPRRIHWRASARVGELMVREFGESLSRPAAIFFDTRGPGGAAFETGVERAASLLWHIDREGRSADLYSYAAVIRGQGLRRALVFLAEVEPEVPASEENLDRWRAVVSGEGGGVFITAGEPPPLPPGTLLRVA